MPPKEKKTFEDIAKEFGLKQKSIDALTKHDADGVSVLAALKKSDIAILDLSLGQSTLLSSWMLKLVSNSAGKATKEVSQGTGKAAKASEPATQSLAQDASLEAEVHDPRIHGQVHGRRFICH